MFSNRPIHTNLAGSQDYANPLTRFAIWDYPIDGQEYTAQVFHGSKILFDIPPTLVVPTVCVNDRIFFVGELLQQSDGTYFIPEQFFYRLPKGIKLSGNPSISDLIEHGDSPPIYEPSVRDLWSLGRKVERTDVCASTFHADRLLITFSSRLALLSPMRRRAFVSKFSSAHFPTFNPISKNLHVVSQVRLMTTQTQR